MSSVRILHVSDIHLRQEELDDQRVLLKGMLEKVADVDREGKVDLVLAQLARGTMLTTSPDELIDRVSDVVEPPRLFLYPFGQFGARVPLRTSTSGRTRQLSDLEVIQTQ